jgi:hypothetical protein
LKADGADMALVEVEVVDKDGNRCPTALNTIDFQLQAHNGAAALRDRTITFYPKPCPSSAVSTAS